jgi:hypothetical protein
MYVAGVGVEIGGGAFRKWIKIGRLWKHNTGSFSMRLAGWAHGRFVAKPMPGASDNYIHGDLVYTIITDGSFPEDMVVGWITSEQKQKETIYFGELNILPIASPTNEGIWVHVKNG